MAASILRRALQCRELHSASLSACRSASLASSPLVRWASMAKPFSSKPVDGGKISRVIGNADGARTTLSVAAFNLRERLVNSRAFSTYPSCGKLNKISEKRNLGDHKRRLLAAKYEMRRKLYKSFCKDPNLPSGLRDIHRYKLSKLPRNSSFTRVRNRCIFTGRSRAIYQFFRVSRIVFRELASRGALMGVKKASW
ncbi:hypothetical protein DITRI_Ditri18aG0073100 [Diplodiscus trichospermus]